MAERCASEPWWPSCSPPQHELKLKWDIFLLLPDSDMCRIRNLLISSPIPYSRCRELLDLTRQAFPCWPGRSAGPVGKPPPDRLRQLSYTYTIAMVTPGVRCCRERFCVFLHEGCAFVYARGAGSCFSPVPEGRQCAFCCARGAGTCFFANARGAGRKMVPTCRRRRGKTYCVIC